jgi:hypothetical protein
MCTSKIQCSNTSYRSPPWFSSVRYCFMSLPQYTFYSGKSRRVRLCVLRAILHQFMYSEKSACWTRETRRSTHARTICSVWNHQLKMRTVGPVQLLLSLCKDGETKIECNINIELNIPYHVMSVFSLTCLISWLKLSNLTRLTCDIWCNTIINIILVEVWCQSMFWLQTSTKIINDVVQTGFMFYRQLFARQEPVLKSLSYTKLYNVV